MRLVIQLVFLAMSLMMPLGADDPVDPVEEVPDSISVRGVAKEIYALKLQLREEALNLREEMYSLLGNRDESGLLAQQLMEIIKEMKETHRLVVEQGEKLAGLEDNVKSVRSDQGVHAKQLSQVDSKMEIMRSEVRLISQQKLTWQNSSYDDKLLADFAVDGVYSLSGDLWGVNPIQHPGRGHNERNFMTIIDLGGIFKIHTIKLWNRIDCCQNHALGVFVYADEHLIGGISEAKRLYEFLANDNVFARKIYVKQSLAKNMNFLEIQVFGNGPFGENELE